MDKTTPQLKKSSENGVHPIDFTQLEEIALDMRWSWSHLADQMWHQLDPSLWELTHNPWVVLQTVSREKLQEKFVDPTFQQIFDELIKSKRVHEQRDTWFKKKLLRFTSYEYCLF